MKFAIVAGDTAGFFSLTKTGGIYVQKTGLDFEAVPAYNLTVRATDKGGLHSDGIIAVHLGDVNDIEILSVGEGVGNDRLMNTLGSQIVSLKGTNYGSNPSSISATYSNAASGRTYSATGCHLVTVGDIECTTVAGSGIRTIYMASHHQYSPVALHAWHMAGFKHRYVVLRPAHH